MHIDKNSYIPLYAQLLDILVEQINTGKLKEHDKLPTEKELCERYNVSRTTVRQTLDELEKQNKIYKQRGKGSFVAPVEKEAKKNKINFINVVEAIKRMGKTPHTNVADFEMREIIEESVASALDCRLGEKVYFIKRIRFADSDPVMLEYTYLPAERFPKLENEDLEAENMHHIFKRKYNLSNISFKREFHAVLIDKKQAAVLHADKGDPAMEMITLGLASGQPFEFTKAIIKGDLPMFLIDM
ncbi:GntR family transcriptional regulator [Weizmannia acidilactici]|uniref:GntR family transcriptional regulator n=1 Tax=Weizmannia acidilactici TaxID=2607726 RepID=UPI00124E2F5C|nr:GntR family transcriptional regulator [Weizmannia acidilactici]GER74678.1 GntR family transcriptional regulator [Weizmannia acidilactici]